MEKCILIWAFIGFLMVLCWILFISESCELIIKHKQNVETIEVLKKRIEVIEEQLEFTEYLLPGGKRNEKTPGQGR